MVGANGFEPLEFLMLLRNCILSPAMLFGHSCYWLTRLPVLITRPVHPFGFGEVLALLKELLILFGEAFNEPETYQGRIPADDYLKRFLILIIKGWLKNASLLLFDNRIFDITWLCRF